MNTKNRDTEIARQIVENTMSLNEIGAQFGISHSTVHRIGARMGVKREHRVGGKDGASRALTHAVLMELLSYNPETGEFTWNRRRTRYGKQKVGQSASSHDIHKNRRRIHLYGKPYHAGRVAWFYVHGNWPDEVIDHINGDALDNRLCNLRSCSFAQNTRNRSTKGWGGIGRTGVSKDKWAFIAYISFQGKRRYLGRFKTAGEAIAAREQAEIETYGEFARGAK